MGICIGRRLIRQHNLPPKRPSATPYYVSGSVWCLALGNPAGGLGLRWTLGLFSVGHLACNHHRYLDCHLLTEPPCAALLCVVDGFVTTTKITIRETVAPTASKRHVPVSPVSTSAMPMSVNCYLADLVPSTMIPPG